MRLLLILAIATSGTHSAAAPTADDAVRAYVRNFLKSPTAEEDRTARYLVAFVDLNGDGVPEAIVHINSQNWCGSGGCTTLVLARTGSTYRLVSQIAVTRLPIRVLKATSNGWNSLGVWVQGGGIIPGYEAELRFSGRGYPRNPTVAPVRESTRSVAGKIVIPKGATGALLYP